MKLVLNLIAPLFFVAAVFSEDIGLVDKVERVSRKAKETVTEAAKEAQKAQEAEAERERERQAIIDEQNRLREEREKREREQAELRARHDAQKQAIEDAIDAALKLTDKKLRHSKGIELQKKVNEFIERWGNKHDDQEWGNDLRMHKLRPLKSG